MEMESLVQNPSLLDGEDGICRQSADYAPSVWGDYFIKHSSPPSSTSSDQKSEELIRERVEELVRQVRNLFADENINGDDLKRLELIDDLQRLGVGYHFEEEIDGLLKRIHEEDDGKITDGNDLHVAALQFRLLRQHGYYVKSADVFGQFKDDGGEFKRHLADDARGLLSLYEACLLATPEDGILDEGMRFARRNLRTLSDGGGALDASMKELVAHALELPLHRRILRLEARYYIEVCGRREEGSQNTIILLLLELARLDFHLLQLLHYQEARTLSIWWNGIGLAENFSFARDRIMECYFWILSVYYEARYTTSRKIMVKVIALLSICDDIYDAYGTYDDLQSFTDTIQRWGVEPDDHLTGCMKLLFHNLTKTFQDFEDELSSIGKSHRVHYLKEAFKVLAKGWLEEVKWRDEGYIPTLEEHLKLTAVTTCYDLLSCASFTGMDDSVTNEVFEWVLTTPKFIHHASLICRLRDDVTSQEFEQKRIHVASAVQCYMKEHNTTLEIANEELLKMVENEWKIVNHEYLSLSGTLPRVVLMRVINLTRFVETTYVDQDKYNHSSLIKDHISKILIEPIPF